MQVVTTKTQKKKERSVQRFNISNNEKKGEKKSFLQSKRIGNLIRRAGEGVA